MLDRDTISTTDQDAISTTDHDTAGARIIARIKELKKERNAVILAHLYQLGEIQDLADYTGDSLGLSQQAARTDAGVIVFCGVHFMAETAAILSPDKIVLLPEPQAGCPMANMVTAGRLRAKKAEKPDAVVVAYVNTSAEVKAEAEVCCTSSNAVKVVQSVDPDREIIFVPDMHLGHYAAKKAGREMTLWRGFCPTHNKLSLEDIQRARAAHPEALVMVHPECRPEVAEAADHVSSTSGMIKFASANPAREFIVGTESGILHRLKKESPDKKFYLASERMVCPNMKSITLEKVLWTLEEMENRVTVPEEIRERAVRAVDRMVEIV